MYFFVTEKMSQGESSSMISNPTDEKTIVAFNRLLLSKQLYLHALDHSGKAGAINKMIAVHNFHNAIEIALRAIFLHYEIRAEKQLNIEFEVMLNEIDNYPQFKDQGIKLPYRQELRNLNQLRNLVQHHAVEPPSTTMDDWRVFTRRFLEQACQTYFGLDFNSLSPLSMVQDSELKELLNLSLSSIQEGEFKRSLALAKVAFEWAGKSMIDFLPDEGFLNTFFITSHISELLGELKTPLEALAEKSRRAKYYAALLSSGVNLVDYKRFESVTPFIQFTIGPYVDIQWGNREEPDEKIAQWTRDFVVATIVQWQTLGLAPAVPEWGKKASKKLIEEIDTIFDS